MLDLKFSGAELSNEVVFRVDAIHIDYNTQVAVLETYGLDDRQPTQESIDSEAEKALLNVKKIVYPISHFVKLAVEHDLKLIATETSGKLVQTFNTPSAG